jgi:hypothetical protein
LFTSNGASIHSACEHDLRSFHVLTNACKRGPPLFANRRVVRPRGPTLPMTLPGEAPHWFFLIGKKWREIEPLTL